MSLVKSYHNRGGSKGKYGFPIYPEFFYTAATRGLTARSTAPFAALNLAMIKGKPLAEVLPQRGPFLVASALFGGPSPSNRTSFSIPGARHASDFAFDQIEHFNSLLSSDGDRQAARNSRI